MSKNDRSHAVKNVISILQGKNVANFASSEKFDNSARKGNDNERISRQNLSLRIRMLCFDIAHRANRVADMFNFISRLFNILRSYDVFSSYVLKSMKNT